MSEDRNQPQDLATRRGSSSTGNSETQTIATCQDPQTIVLAPLIEIYVNFEQRSVRVTQNDEPLGNAQVPASVNTLTLELRPSCSASIPVPPGRHPEGGG